MQPRIIILALATLLTFSLAGTAQTKRKSPNAKATRPPVTVTLVRWPYT